MTYYIQYNGSHGWETVDQTTDPDDAEYLLNEYRIAYPVNSELRVVKRHD
jgi:hypothetical protein